MEASKLGNQEQFQGRKLSLPTGHDEGLFYAKIYEHLSP